MWDSSGSRAHLVEPRGADRRRWLDRAYRHVRYAGDRRSGLRQGGRRKPLVQLSTPGTVTLTATGLTFAAYRATPDRYQGHFISSDDQLNRIWYGQHGPARQPAVNKVTIRDVAALARVSPVSVPNYFHKPSKLSASTRERVCRARY
jgi:hypothetical protein